MISRWAAAEGISLEIIRLYAGEPLPSRSRLRQAGGVTILGGPMGADDTDRYPWLANEIELIRTFIDLKIPLLGICLGAQLISAALGAEVHSMERREIGWWPVEDIGTAEKFVAFHWHGDTFALPSGSTRLYTNPACREQGFRIGSKVLALQFHLEMDVTAVERIITACGDELSAALGNPHVQDRNVMLGYAKTYQDECYMRLVTHLKQLFLS